MNRKVALGVALIAIGVIGILAVTTYLFRPSSDIELASGIAEEYLDSLHDADLGIDEIMDSEEEPHIKKAQA